MADEPAKKDEPKDPPAKHYPWEDALLAFADESHKTITNRDQVTAKPWVTGIEVYTGFTSTLDTYKTKSSSWAGYDMWAEWTYPGTNYSTIIGVTTDWNFWQLTPESGATDTKLGFFGKAADTILGPLLFSAPYDNGRTGAHTLNEAASLLRNVNKWLGDQLKTVKDWADHVDGAGDDFQGSAAGRFKEVLMGLRSEIAQIHMDLGDGTAQIRADALDAAATALRKATWDLYDSGYNKWRGKPASGHRADGSDLGTAAAEWTVKADDTSFSWPYACIHSTFQIFTLSLTPTKVSDTLASWTTTDAGIPLPSDNEAFRIWLDNTAKQVWRTWIEKTLDAQATTTMTTFKGDYRTAAARLQKIAPPRMWLPPDKAPAPPDGSKPPPGTGDGDKGKKDLGLDGNDKDKKGDGGPGGSVPPPPPKGDLGGIGGKNGIGGIGGNTGTGGGTGAQAPLLDGKGNPVLDKDGKPIMVPPGSRVNDKGQVVDKDGKPVLGKDGKPLVVPPGTVVGQPNTGTGGNTGNNTGAGGGPFKVPVGSKRNPDGTVTGPDGKQLLDANGNPIVLGQDDTIDKDGVVLGGDGKPISQFEQLMRDQAHAVISGRPNVGGNPGGSTWTGLPTGSGGISFGGGSGTGGFSYKGTDLFGQPFGGSGGSSIGGSGVRTGGGITAGGPPTVGIGGTTAALANGTRSAAELAAEAKAGRELAAERAAAANAAEEAQLMGRNVSTTGGSGMPMMPPMGAGAGAGAGAPGEKDRQRTTWLAEDEEVWGTDSGAVTGVIGR